MTRIGIVTLQGDSNLGNRLQNFALQEALLTLGGDEVSTLRLPPGLGPFSLDGRAERTMQQALARARGLRAGGLRHLSPSVRRGLRARRDEELERGALLAEGLTGFTAERIRQTGPLYGPTAEFKDFASTLDKVVVGSDQVWHPGFGLPPDLAFLGFVPRSKRLAYAASFGVSDVPAAMKRRYRAGLAGMRSITVREARGAQIVRRLAGVEAGLVLDPTMLVPAARWRALARGTEGRQGQDYVLRFEIRPGATDAYRPPAAEWTSLGLREVDFFDDVRAGRRRGDVSAFIEAISGARAVVTDSFHASAFCLLLHTPVRATVGAAMGSRFDALSQLAGTPLGEAGRADALVAESRWPWSAVDERLAIRRSSSLTALAAML